jgi:hypothetical protein
MFSLVGYSQTDSTEVDDSLPSLEEFYYVKPFTNLSYFKNCYAQMKHGEKKLYDHLVVKKYHKATSNLIVNAEVNKMINQYRKGLGLSQISTESIMSERIISNHKESILHVLNELDRKPLVMQLLVESEKCECGKSIFENIFDYTDIVDVIRDPLTIYFDVAHYQVSKSGNQTFSYTIITYEYRGYDHPFYEILEHEPETK